MRTHTQTQCLDRLVKKKLLKLSCVPVELFLFSAQHQVYSCTPVGSVLSQRKATQGDQGDDAEGSSELGGTLPGPVQAQSSPSRVTWGLLVHHHSSASISQHRQYSSYVDNPGLIPEGITRQWSWYGRAKVLVAGEFWWHRSRRKDGFQEASTERSVQ